MLNLNFQNGQAPALNARNMNAIVESINTLGYAVGGPNVASTVSAMTDTSKVYVYTGSETGYTAGNWYYYNGSAWVSGGVYQAAAVETDTTLTMPGEPADAKATGDAIADLKSAIDIKEKELSNAGIIPQNIFRIQRLSADNYNGIEASVINSTTIKLVGTPTSGTNIDFSFGAYVPPSNSDIYFQIISSQSDISGFYSYFGWFNSEGAPTQGIKIENLNTVNLIHTTDSSGGSRHWMHFKEGVAVDTIMQFVTSTEVFFDANEVTNSIKTNTEEIKELQNYHDYFVTFENSVRIEHNETVEIGAHSIDLDTPIALGTKAMFKNESTTTTMSLGLVKDDGTSEVISTGVSPGNVITFIAPVNAVGIRSYCNNTQWNFTLEYGEGITNRIEENEMQIKKLETSVFGTTNTTTKINDGFIVVNFPLYEELYNVSFSDITHPLTVVGVYGKDSEGQSTLLATIRDFTKKTSINVDTYYESLGYYVQFVSGVGEVKIHIENESVKKRFDEKQDKLIAGANITIAGNVISSEGGGGGSIGRYSVKDFGAVGDGITIDTEAIQNCITAAEGTGYEVYFPAGTYLVDDTIIIHYASICGSVAQDNNGVNLENSVKIVATTSDGIFKLMPTEGTSVFTILTIKNIILDGGGTAEYGIFMDRREACLSGVYCENALIGLKMTKIYNGIFMRSVFNNNKRYGIYMETACNNLMFLECLCGGNSRESETSYANVYAANPTGTPALENSNIKFIGCELDAPYHSNAYNFVLNDCCVLTFDKNYFEGSKAGIMYLSNVQVLNITDNYFIDVILDVNDQSITGSFIGNSFKLYNTQSGKAVCNLKNDAIKGGNYIANGYTV